MPPNDDDDNDTKLVWVNLVTPDGVELSLVDRVLLTKDTRPWLPGKHLLRELKILPPDHPLKRPR